MAWQWKHGARAWPSFVEVTNLDWGLRLCPERGSLVKRPDSLRTALSRDEAARILQERF
jgi:hypothetical protein